MKNIKIDNVEYQIPTQWSDVTVRRFENIVKIALKKDMYETQLEFGLRVISAVTDIPYNILLSVKPNQFKEIEDCISFSNVEIEPKNTKEYIINGIKYIPIENYNSLTMGECIDAELIIKDSEQYNLLANLLPLLVRRANKNKPEKFNPETYNDMKELFANNLKIEDVLHLKDFF